MRIEAPNFCVRGCWLRFRFGEGVSLSPGLSVPHTMAYCAMQAAAGLTFPLLCDVNGHKMAQAAAPRRELVMRLLWAALKGPADVANAALEELRAQCEGMIQVPALMPSERCLLNVRVCGNME